MQAPNTTPQVVQPATITQASFQGGQHDRDHPSLLADNEYYKGVNVQIRDAGKLATRDGIATKTTSPGGNPQAAAWFQSVSGSPVIVQVNGGRFYTWGGSGTSWTRIGTTQLTNTSSPVKLSVLNNVLYVHSGTNDNAWSWDGVAASFLDEGNTNADAPRGNVAATQSGRVFVSGVTSSQQDYIFPSDIFDGHTYDRNLNNIRTPTPTSEAVTAMAMYRKQELLVTTANSCHLWTVAGATISGFSRNTIDPNIGCIAQKSLVVVGEDAIFLGADRNLRTIKRTINDIAFGVSVPITFNNPNLMARINKTFAYLCAGVYFNNYYLLAAPMDTNIQNSSVIAFDMLHQVNTSSGVVPACVGEWTGISACEFVVTNFNGIQQLYYIDSNNGNAILMFSGVESDDGNQISYTVQTKAFDWGAPNNDKTLHSGEIQLFNSQGTLTITYAKDDAQFTAYGAKTVGDPTAANLPISLPFNLPGTTGVTLLFLPFYGCGRSRYWQLELVHTGGTIAVKQLSLRAWVENLTTR